MPHIWVPKIKIIENTKAALTPPKVGVGGMFQIVGRLDDGRSRVIADWQPNLITDTGLDRMGQGTQISYCAVGSGNTTPQNTDTALTTFVAQHSSLPSEGRGCAGTSPYYGYYSATFRFNAPGTNRTIRELGFGWGTSGTNLFSHALIKDSGGNPIDVSWLAAETLDVSYQARMYLPLSDSAFTMTIGGSTHTGTVRTAYATNNQLTSFRNSGAITIDQYANPTYGTASPAISNGTIGAITGNISSPTYSPGSFTSTPAYTTGTYRRTGTYVIGPTAGNLSGGISAMMFHNGVQAYQFSLSPAINKVVDFTLTLNLETPTWGRYAG